MASNSVWLVGDDVSLFAGLRESFEQDTGISLLWNDLEVALPREYPQCVLVDLRGAAQWSQLQSLRQRVKHLKGQPVPFVGLVEEGLPLERVQLVEDTLSKVLKWPSPDLDWRRTLDGAIAHERERAARPAEFRELACGDRRFVTYTPEMFSFLDDLEIAARCDFTIMLVGETGTGKTTLARLIHDLSPRSSHRFLTVPCGSLPSELLDSELFGHVRGAFTGADKTKEGKFDAATGGTVLLDEIDVLAISQQAKLLRVLETGEFEPVGSNETRITNTRTIVASNVCLEAEVQRERFRPDLFFRLNQMRFEVPPLRKRPLDIVPLAVDAITECCQEHKLPARRVHPDFLEALKVYPWPGNIRELRNEVRRAALFARDGWITPALLPAAIQRELEGRRSTVPGRNGLASEVAQTEQDMIESMLKTQNFNRAATARALGISRVTLYNKLRKYGIQASEI